MLFVVLGIVAAVLILILAIWVAITYNKLVRTRNVFRNSFAQIDVQLKRRHDLIPNLVETVKGYLAHERQTIESVVQARAAAMTAQSALGGDVTNAAGVQGLADSENMLTQALGRLFALAEGYPELKASQNMLQLGEELSSTENRVAFARQAYNDAVMFYNTTRESVPNNLIAGPFGFGPATLFQLDDPAERATPNVGF